MPKKPKKLNLSEGAIKTLQMIVGAYLVIVGGVLFFGDMLNIGYITNQIQSFLVWNMRLGILYQLMLLLGVMLLWRGNLAKTTKGEFKPIGKAILGVILLLEFLEQFIGNFSVTLHLNVIKLINLPYIDLFYLILIISGIALLLPKKK